MNNKLLISVSLPILDISFDLEVPNIIKVGSLKNIILDYVRNNYNNDMNLGTFVITDFMRTVKLNST